VLLSIVRYGIAFLFLFSGISKLVSPQSFFQSIVEFDLISEVLIIPTITIIVGIECICGFMLLFNMKVLYASMTLMGLCLIFTVAIIVVLIQNKSISCGCFGDAMSSQVSLWLIMRNVVMIAILYKYIFRPTQQNFKQ